MSTRNLILKTIKKGKTCYVRIHYENSIMDYSTVIDIRNDKWFNVKDKDLEELNNIERLLYVPDRR